MPCVWAHSSREKMVRGFPHTSYKRRKRLKDKLLTVSAELKRPTGAFSTIIE
jgi:hypothetical protein